ncbi:hypothetical protein FH969_02495 [Miniimonas arenae]|uniref:DUF975 family protein n=1 Tax=Miniimonas arenae TaxID=676201 RepID=A0A5C5BDM2_9MICO|nr:hypothetical protein [Miniimonas arenae]TNU76590.1 hypothetical protein FH969_02495 [Miniimonas arenae]
MSEPNAPEEKKPTAPDGEGSTPAPPPPAWGGTEGDSPAPTTPPAPSAPAPSAPSAPSWGATPSDTPPPSAPPAYGSQTPPSPYGAPSAPTPPPAYGAPSQPTPPSPYGAPSQPTPPYGAPPQPSSAYPQSSDAGYTPPPGSGGFPTPPPAPEYGYGSQQAGYAGGYQQPADIGSALGWGWKKFGQNAGVLIGSHVLWYLVIIAIALVGFAVAGLFGTTRYNTSDGVNVAAAFGVFGSIVLYFFVFAAVFLAQIGLINGYLTIADGQRAALGTFFTFRNIGAALLAVLLIAVVSAVLSIVPVIGSIAVAFFTVFALYFVVDRNQDAISGIRSAATLAIQNPAQTLLLIVVTYLLNVVGALVCGVGLLVTVPLAGLATVYLYRRLSGGQVAAA